MTTTDDSDELAAGHALDALSGADLAAAEELSASDERFTRSLDADRNTIAALAEIVTPVEPPPHLREALLAAVGHPSEPQPESNRPPAPRRRAWFALAASIVVIAALAIGAVLMSLQPDAAAVALGEIHQAPDAQSTIASVDGAEATLHWSTELNRAVLTTEGMPALADSSYELWVIDEEGPRSAGVMDGGDRVTTEVLGGVSSGDVVAVTIEAEGGSPTGQPTSDPILQFETSA